MLLAKRFIKRIEGAKRTRKTLKDDFTALRRRGDADEIEAGGKDAGELEPTG
jgi:hypothetical protein